MSRSGIRIKVDICDIKSFLKGFIKSGIVLYLFYRSAVIVVLCAAFYGIYSIPLERKKRMVEWRWRINLEFKEVMLGIAASLNAGYSIENAFEESIKDLRILYGDGSELACEIEQMVCKIRLNQPIEKILMEFAEYTKVDDIYSFAEVFQTAKKTGGDLIEIARSTASRISSRIEVKREIKTLLAGKSMEGKIMNYIPLGIIAYFWICSPGFLDCLYISSGRIVMSILLAIYILAFKWNERIMDIEV